MQFKNKNKRKKNLNKIKILTRHENIFQFNHTVNNISFPLKQIKEKSLRKMKNSF